jgi:hypothetical protein
MANRQAQKEEQKMTPETVLALSKLTHKLAQANRSRIAAGSYPLDMVITVRVHGTMHVAEDQEYVPTSAIPWKKTLALFMRYSGVTREQALSMLQLCMSQALVEDESAEDLLDNLADLDEVETKLQKMLGELPKQKRKGLVTVKELQLEEVTPATIETACASEEV